MSILPKNEVLQPKTEPKNFFIYGATMSGKSYFSSFFPNPLVLNTDGNSAQGTAPSIQIRNIRNADGTLAQSCIKQLDDIITALQSENHGYETIIIDVIDDICVMIEQAICIRNNVESIGDIPYGKGYSLFNGILQQFVMDLKALPYNIIYISRELIITDEKTNRTEAKPSLKDKYYNIVNGNCDLVVHTQKFGSNNYYRSVTDRRTVYKPENITNEKVKKLLQSVNGMFQQENK